MGIIMNNSIAAITAIKENINRVIIGKEKLIDLMLAAVIAEGHVLLEDVPGTGKTLLAKALAKSINADFSRIQFTPDLLPSDITGLNYYNQKEGKFVFRKGPVFCNILLADEINRATPRTQSSLLECMEERQVTVDGETRALEMPFFVIATQNPVETSGTFPLPEAQLDRFIMQLSMGLPTQSEELAILNRFLADNPLDTLLPVCSKETFVELQDAYKSIYVHPQLMEYIVKIVAGTRDTKKVLMGVSPRGTLAMLRCVRAYALVQGREYAVPEDIKELAAPVFAHRIVFPPHMMGNHSSVEFVEGVLSSVPVPTENFNIIR